MKKGIVSITLDPDVHEDGKILAALMDAHSFSDYVNQLIAREAEVERYRIEEMKNAKAGVHQPVSR